MESIEYATICLANLAIKESIMEWNLAEAKNRLTEVVNRAIAEGPQVIRRRKDTVVVVSEVEYERLTGKKPGFKEYLFDGPSLEGLNLERDSSGCTNNDSSIRKN